MAGDSWKDRRKRFGAFVRGDEFRGGVQAAQDVADLVEQGSGLPTGAALAGMIDTVSNIGVIAMTQHKVNTLTALLKHANENPSLRTNPDKPVLLQQMAYVITKKKLKVGRRTGRGVTTAICPPIGLLYGLMNRGYSAAKSIRHRVNHSRHHTEPEHGIYGDRGTCAVYLWAKCKEFHDAGNGNNHVASGDLPNCIGGYAYTTLKVLLGRERLGKMLDNMFICEFIADKLKSST